MTMLGILEMAVGFGVIILFIAAGILMVRKFSRGYPRDTVADSPERQALEDVHSRLGELDQLNQRINEVEERLDFAERLLAGKRDEQRLEQSRD